MFHGAAMVAPKQPSITAAQGKACQTPPCHAAGARDNEQVSARSVRRPVGERARLRQPTFCATPSTTERGSLMTGVNAVFWRCLEVSHRNAEPVSRPARVVGCTSRHVEL